MQKAQIEPPEQFTRIDQSVEVNEETSNDEVVQACSEIVAANVGNLLNNRLRLINSRIGELEFVDQRTYVHKIEELKAALDGLYQKLKFASYDYEYGLEDNNDHLRATVGLPGENAELLSKFGAITWVLELADRALISSHKDIAEIQKVIDEAKRRLADLEQSNQHKKEKATHKRTINSREKRLKPKKRRHNNLVIAINNMLNVEPKDAETMLKGAESLLAEIIKGRWIDKDTKFPTLDGIKKQFRIDKIKEEVEEAVGQIAEEGASEISRMAKSRRNRRRRARKRGRNSQPMAIQADLEESPEWQEEKVEIINMVEALPEWMQKLTPATNNKELLICALLSIVSFFTMWQYTKPDQKINNVRLPHPVHEIQKKYPGKNGKMRTLKILCPDGLNGMDDDTIKAAMIENARKSGEFTLNAPHMVYEEDLVAANKANKANPIVIQNENGRPLSFVVKFTNYTQGLDSWEKLSSEEEKSLFEVTMIRNLNVVVEVTGGATSTHVIPLSKAVTFKTTAIQEE